MDGATPDDSLLARQVLEEGSEAALAELIGRLAPRLLRTAAKRTRSPALAQQGDPEDLVQKFLMEKLLPARQQSIMLGSIARGDCPLWPKICRSFENFLNSLLRKRTLPLSSQAVGQGEGEHDPPDRSPQGWPDITEQIAAQLAAIRQLPQPRQGTVPFGAIMLLSERIVLAKPIAEYFAPDDGRTAGNQSVREYVEGLAPWETDEETTALPPNGIELKGAWEELCLNTEERPQLAGASEVAAVLGCSKAVWLQWVCRGRVKLVQQLGQTDARSLFPYWPEGLFERAPVTAKEGEP